MSTDDDNAELVYYAPQPIGSISPDTLTCPSCRSRRVVKQLSDDSWDVTLIHEESCLRAHRRLSDPNAN